LFGNENPQDSAATYGVQIVPATATAQARLSSLVYVETSAPNDSLLAVRIVNGTLGPGPGDGSGVALCMCVPAGVSHIPLVTKGAGADDVFVFAGIFERTHTPWTETIETGTDATNAVGEDSGDAASTTKAEPAPRVDTVGGDCAGAVRFVTEPMCDGGKCDPEVLVFGVCPSTVLRAIAARSLSSVAVAEAGASTAAQDAATDASPGADASAGADAGLDASDGGG
jgi:hypothetical protein